MESSQKQVLWSKANKGSLIDLREFVRLMRRGSVDFGRADRGLSLMDDTRIVSRTNVGNRVETKFSVPSSRGGTWHPEIVTLNGVIEVAVCQCEDFTEHFQNGELDFICKHLFACIVGRGTPHMSVRYFIEDYNPEDLTPKYRKLHPEGCNRIDLIKDGLTHIPRIHAMGTVGQTIAMCRDFDDYDEVYGKVLSVSEMKPTAASRLTGVTSDYLKKGYVITEVKIL